MTSVMTTTKLHCFGCGECICDACSGYEDECEECVDIVSCFECRRMECMDCVECSWVVCPCCQRFICNTCINTNHNDLTAFHDCKLEINACSS